VGVRGSGVRIMDRESPIHTEPGLFKFAVVKDPWVTKIELVEDPEQVGFHHIHLFSADPPAALKWYQTAFGGKPARMKGRLDGLLYGKTWLLVTPPAVKGAALQPTEGRAIDHLAFSFADLDSAAAELKKKGIPLRQEPTTVSDPEGPGMKAAMIAGPDNILVEAVQR
jgi:catechol 2,3-dioxygenase-like lactoylglutathione lyase family enzyme